MALIWAYMMKLLKISDYQIKVMTMMMTMMIMIIITMMSVKMSLV